MNDFTKDELEDILSWADVYTELGMSWTYKLHKPLIDKIQIMIENYENALGECKHVWVLPSADLLIAGYNSQCKGCHLLRKNHE